MFTRWIICFFIWRLSCLYAFSRFGNIFFLCKVENSQFYLGWWKLVVIIETAQISWIPLSYYDIWWVLFWRWPYIHWDSSFRIPRFASHKDYPYGSYSKIILTFLDLFLIEMKVLKNLHEIMRCEKGLFFNLVLLLSIFNTVALVDNGVHLWSYLWDDWRACWDIQNGQMNFWLCLFEIVGNFMVGEDLTSESFIWLDRF
jgi:hypothetical protein